MDYFNFPGINQVIDCSLNTMQYKAFIFINEFLSIIKCTVDKDVLFDNFFLIKYSVFNNKGNTLCNKKFFFQVAPLFLEFKCE